MFRHPPKKRLFLQMPTPACVFTTETYPLVAGIIFLNYLIISYANFAFDADYAATAVLRF